MNKNSVDRESTRSSSSLFSSKRGRKKVKSLVYEDFKPIQRPDGTTIYVPPYGAKYLSLYSLEPKADNNSEMITLHNPRKKSEDGEHVDEVVEAVDEVVVRNHQSLNDISNENNVGMKKTADSFTRHSLPKLGKSLEEMPSRRSSSSSDSSVIEEKKPKPKKRQKQPFALSEEDKLRNKSWTGSFQKFIKSMKKEKKNENADDVIISNKNVSDNGIGNTVMGNVNNKRDTDSESDTERKSTSSSDSTTTQEDVVTEPPIEQTLRDDQNSIRYVDSESSYDVSRDKSSFKTFFSKLSTNKNPTTEQANKTTPLAESETITTASSDTLDARKSWRMLDDEQEIEYINENHPTDDVFHEDESKKRNSWKLFMLNRKSNDSNEDKIKKRKSKERIKSTEDDDSKHIKFSNSQEIIEPSPRKSKLRNSLLFFFPRKKSYSETSSVSDTESDNNMEGEYTVNEDGEETNELTSSEPHLMSIKYLDPEANLQKTEVKLRNEGNESGRISYSADYLDKMDDSKLYPSLQKKNKKSPFSWMKHYIGGFNHSDSDISDYSKKSNSSPTFVGEFYPNKSHTSLSSNTSSKRIKNSKLKGFMAKLRRKSTGDVSLNLNDKRKSTSSTVVFGKRRELSASEINSGGIEMELPESPKIITHKSETAVNQEEELKFEYLPEANIIEEKQEEKPKKKKWKRFFIRRKDKKPKKVKKEKSFWKRWPSQILMKKNKKDKNVKVRDSTWTVASDTESADHGSTDKTSVAKLTESSKPSILNKMNIPNIFKRNKDKVTDNEALTSTNLDNRKESERLSLEEVKDSEGVVYAELDLCKGQGTVLRKEEDKTEYAEIVHAAKTNELKNKEQLSRSRENLMSSRENLADTVTSPDGKKEAAV